MKEYIERDAAKELMEQALVDEWEIQYADDRLDEIPAADVVEVKHGWWIVHIHDPVGTVCSECGFSWSRSITAVTLNPALSKIQTRYCPNCGAKMDGGVSDAAD